MAKHSYLAILFLFLCTSCTHYYYVPASKNVPLFKEKNEYRATLTAASANYMKGNEVQAAYSITNRVAVMANYLYMDGGSRETDNWGRGEYFESAVGYYKPFRKKGVFEVFAGMGVGDQHHQYERSSVSFLGVSKYNIGNSDLSFTKVFIQPSIGMSSKVVDMAFTAGFSRLNFHKVRNGINEDELEYQDVMDISNHRTSYLLENAITLRGGWKYLKLQLQYQTSTNLSSPKLKFEEGLGSIGLHFAFAERFRRRR